MQNREKRVLSIAGFDPSGGAGVLADVKTFEKLGVPSCGVISAVTYQNSNNFFGVEWQTPDEIIRQLKALEEEFSFEYVKIGLIENLNTLSQVVTYLIDTNNDCKIIWDPVMKASTGHVFFSEIKQEQWGNLAANLFLVTPNLDEVRRLSPDKEPLDAASNIGKQTNILLKGGHDVGESSDDLLIYEGEVHKFSSPRIHDANVHGTGCVLSSAITAYLYQGEILPAACRKAKEFVTDYIIQNTHAAAYSN